MGKEYRIACSADEREALINSAQMLDQQMRKVHETGKVAGADRIAVLAALNLTHELSQNTTSSNSQDITNFSDRLVNLRSKIENVLENP
jgi:cell division protein ZapA